MSIFYIFLLKYFFHLGSYIKFALESYLKLWGDEIFGRHALLSRGWGARDKHSVMPDPTKIGSDWG
jgi:hypothetical protein